MGDRIGRFKNFHLNFMPPRLMRAIALRRMATADMSFSDVEFKIVSSEEEMIEVFELLNECYVRRGIAGESQMRMQVISLLPTTTTFIAHKKTRHRNTISYRGLRLRATHREST